MMAFKPFLKILNVYPNEWWIVKRLYLLQFFQGAGISFLFTSAFAQFVERFPITQLPWVMIWSALLLWVAGFLYAKFEHRLSFATFNISVLVFMTGSMFLMWVANFSIRGDWFLYLLMAWFNVLYMLNNMEFWGIAALVFDLRQSKRLFAVISGGDIPAKFIGYTLALIFVPYTGTQNLLLIGSACMLVSIPFFISIIRSGKLDHLQHQTRHQHQHASQKKIGKLVSNLVTNNFIRRIAFISLITSTCVILINYGFYGEVKKAYHDDVTLASFIAFFYACTRILAFVTKMVFSSRLTASIGVRPAMFITPMAMLIMTIIIASVRGLTDDQKLIFYLFGVGSMLVDVLRTSFNSPVLLTLMQPLPTHERLRAHNIVKGIMDPFASLLCGIILLTLFNMHEKVDLMFLCYVLFVLGALWIAGVVLVNRQYMTILMKTIGSRFFSRDEFNLSDDKIREQVRAKMMKGTEVEVISILTMLSSQQMDSIAEDLITQLLTHPSDKVKVEALRVMNNRNFSNARDSIIGLLQNETEEKVRLEAVKIFCRIGSDDWGMATYLDSSQEGLRSAAITGMLGNAALGIRHRGELMLSGLLHAGNKEERRAGLHILKEVKDHYDHPDHSRLINDPDPEIQAMAIRAIGKAASPDTVNALFAGAGGLV